MAPKIILNLLLLICIDVCDVTLVVKPRDTEVAVNHSTFFNCSTTESSGRIRWYHKHGYNHVYSNGKLWNEYYKSKRFDVEINMTAGSFNLIIRNVTIEDAGLYICKEEEAGEEEWTAQLIVLEKYPICKSNKEGKMVIGQNDWGNVSDEVEFSCSVPYQGNIPPSLRWVSVEGHSSAQLQNSSCESKNQTVVCSTTIRGDILSKTSSLICETSRSANNQYNCSSELKILPRHLQARHLVTVVVAVTLSLIAAVVLAVCCLWQHRRKISFISVSFTVKLDSEVWGVTRLRNEIYVLCQNPREILVFEDLNEFSLQKKIEINQIQRPWDIGSSEKENSLYVADSEGRCVWKIKPEETDQRIVKWLDTAGDDEPRRLSVSSDGQFLLVCWSGSTEKFSLKIYGAEADLRLSVKFEEENLWHAVKTSTGNFFILHKWKKEDKQGSGGSEKREEWMWVVSELSGDGKTIIRRFTPENEEQKLINPQFLSIDSADRVFLADLGNSDKGIDGRVILLDSDLNWNRILLPTKDEKEGKGNGIRYPWTLFYDKDKNHLIVGGQFHKGINVYSLNDLLLSF